MYRETRGNLMNLGISHRGQAVSFTAEIAERFLEGQWAELCQEHLPPDQRTQAAQALETVREWEQNPSLQLNARLKQAGQSLLRWSRGVSRTDGNEDQPLFLRIFAACSLAAVQPDWSYWACACSDAARRVLDWPEPCSVESDYQSTDLARRTGQSVLAIQSVQEYEGLEEMVQEYEGRQVWFGPPLVGRPSQMIRWHPPETSDEEERIPASGQKLSLRGWEYPMFRDVYMNNELLTFPSERQVLRAVWLISQWGLRFQSCSGHAVELQLTPEQLSELRNDRGEILPVHYTVISPRDAFCQRGPLLCGRWTQVWQRQNVWGHDEFAVNVWERHHYRRLTLNTLEAVFPTLQSVHALAFNLSRRACHPVERGNTLDITIPGQDLARLLPAGMMYAEKPLGGDAQLRGQRELWAQGGWLPPGRGAGVICQLTGNTSQRHIV
jgi:hypothetical protein